MATICKLNSRVLQADLDAFGVKGDAYRFLLALTGVESSFGHNTKPRHEPAYDVGGRYFSEKLHAAYGYHAQPSPIAFSYSSFQMMFPVAYELGYEGNPEYLTCDEDYNGGDWIVCPLVCLYMKERGLEKDAKTLESLYDAFNSGSPKGWVPEEYIQKAMGFYEKGTQWMEQQLA